MPTDPSSPRTLVLYVREGCHLCDAMERELEPFVRRFDLRCRREDVDGSIELARRYGHKVPVLVDGDFEICHYFLDEEQLLARLGESS
jgi:hypothetical protein